MNLLSWATTGRVFRGAAALALFSTVTAWADDNPAGEPVGVLLLKNGHALSGQLIRSGDRYVLRIPDGEIRIRAADVELVCRTMDEVYGFKRDQILSERADEHLNLADWCSRQGMPGHAAEELSAAMRIDPHHPRIAVLERTLREARLPKSVTGEIGSPRDATAASDPSAQQANVERTNEELDRLVRNLPPGAMESFVTTIQPILINGCTTSNCHGTRGKSDFQLERPPLERNLNPRLAQRNLQAVLAQIDRNAPTESPILAVPVRPHGNVTTPLFAGRQAGLHQQLADWVALVSQGDLPNPARRALPQKEALDRTLGNYGFGPLEENRPAAEENQGGTAGIYVGHRPSELKRDKTFRPPDPRQRSANGKTGDREGAKSPSVGVADSASVPSLPATLPNASAAKEEEKPNVSAKK